MNSKIQRRIPEEERNEENDFQQCFVARTPLHTVYWDWLRGQEESSFSRTNLQVNHA
jgi:hypothetical protein